MNKTCVYLAGPIVGCTEGEAKNWRDEFIAGLAVHNIQGISPLRCEPLMDTERYAGIYADPCFGTASAIATKNFTDVQRCDMTLCYMPADMVARRVPIGTLMELAWAHALRKPVIVLSDSPVIREHPVVQSCANWMLSTPLEAMDVILGVLGDYAKRECE